MSESCWSREAIHCKTFRVACVIGGVSDRNLALLYAAFPGVFFGVWRDLSEPLAYSLTAVALLAFDGDRPRRIALSAALFSVAILTREGAAVFALVWEIGRASCRERVL